MTSPSLHRQVEQRLQSRDVRYTTGRRAIVAVLAEASGPRSAAELHREVGETVPLSSLYRTLAILEDSGVATPHFASKGLARYELAEWLSGHHHHLVCLACGEVTDIAITTRHEESVISLVDEIARDAGFTPENHAFEIEGRCAKCA